MITAVVQIKMPKSVSQAQAKAAALASAPKYQQVSGLIRKYYIVAEDGSVGGGIYLWQSKANAENIYTESWRKEIQERFGNLPEISYFVSPVVVDNLTSEIIEG